MPCTRIKESRNAADKNKLVLPQAKTYLAELTHQASTHIKASVRLQPVLLMEALESHRSGTISELKSLVDPAGSSQDQFKYFCNYSTSNS